MASSQTLQSLSVSRLHKSINPVRFSSLSSPAIFPFIAEPQETPSIDQFNLCGRLSATVGRYNTRAARNCKINLTPSPAGELATAIALTDNALRHLTEMRSEHNQDLCLRIGVKQGGCSGLSYTMEFESKENTRPDDSVMEYNGFIIVCDPKSLLFLFGMQLDSRDALIGGGTNVRLW